MRVIGLILARGGSKGVPFKNIRNFCGKPLIARTIEIAKKSKFLSDIYVSTDSLLISKISKLYGAEVINRPNDISTDTSTSVSGIIHALKYIKEIHNFIPDIIVLMQCTAPFFSNDDIDGVINKMIQEEADSTIAVIPFNHFLWKQDKYQAFAINHDGKIRKRRQDSEKQYLETGSIYAMKTSSFLEEHTCFCGKTSLYEISDINSIEIDSALDFYNCENINNWLTKSQYEQLSYKNKGLNFESKIYSSKCIIIREIEISISETADYKVINISNKAIIDQMQNIDLNNAIIITNEELDLNYKQKNNCLIFTTKNSSIFLQNQADYVFLSNDKIGISQEFNFIRN